MISIVLILIGMDFDLLLLHLEEWQFQTRATPMASDFL